MLSLNIGINNKSNMSFKISKIFAIPLIFSSFLFDTNNEFNKVNANVKNSPANKNDLDLYHGMGVSFLCNATRKGFDLDFPKTLNVASSTFASVVAQKHGWKIIEKKKEQKVDIKLLENILTDQNIQIENDINVSINKFIAKRNEYRNNKEFDKADYMRNRLDEIGIVIEDGNESGWRWKNS